MRLRFWKRICTFISSKISANMQRCLILDEDGENLSILYYFLAFCTGGFLLIVSYWRADWALKMKCCPCSLKRATNVLLRSSSGDWSVENVQLVILDLSSSSGSSLCADLEEESVQYAGEFERLLDVANAPGEVLQRKYFCHRHLRYVWNEEKERFELLRGLDVGTYPVSFYLGSSGLHQEEIQNRQKLYGANLVDVDVADPFYVFQFCSIILWSFDNYYYYAGAIFMVSFVSIVITIYQTRMHLITLKEMVALSETVTVLRNNAVQVEISSEDLVPGDVLVIPPKGAMIHCDAVLISGNCIVNESMLTGESVPVTKTPLPNAKRSPGYSEEEREQLPYNPERQKRHTLFSGTRVIQTRYYGRARVLAVVVRTGFSTTKGRLIRSILNPKPVGFKFFRDSMRFIGFLSVLALAGFSYSVYIFVKQGRSAGRIILNALDIITVAVPPALPAAMSVGTVYALQRLKKQQIYCINPSRINVCGKLKLFCFDKTGTLTEDGLDFLGVVPTDSARFGLLNCDSSSITQSRLLAAMACCHSLMVIDGQLTGDPLDLKMFQATDWVPYEIAIIRQFPFSSDLKRMCVVTRTLAAPNMDVYAKGAPETIASLCQPQTVPGDFHDVLQRYTMQGYRVLGLAWKPLDPKLSWHQLQRVTRDHVETDLIFLGLLILQNALKAQSAAVIRQLHRADIRTVMVTGDNMLTAVSVARDCGMVGSSHKVIEVTATPDEDKAFGHQIAWKVLGEKEETSVPLEERRRPTPCPSYHFAMSGKTFSLIRNHSPELLKKLLISGTVFARMSPEQKTQLIEGIQKLSYCVGMCGDGANDCGALKAAHAGIALSEAEASVASPFTSKIPNIECVPTVIREGRAALVTSFGTFKYMALYSIIQFVSVILLYSISSNLGDLQYLYIDLVIITSLALVSGSLMSPVVLFSLISQITVQTIIQVAGFYYVQSQTWFEAVHVTNKNEAYIECHQNAVVFALSSFQYIQLSIVFSGGAPYRKPFYKSVYFLIVVLVLTIFTGILVVSPGSALQKFFQLAEMPDAVFRITLVGIAGANFLLSLFIEEYVVSSRWLKKLLNKLICKSRPKNYFRILQHQLEEDPSWPPLSS
ncbi:Polyamine-transporting ATPase 13A3 [Acropora cervicornis]|uniref:Cation-transporting ATPase n=1 Tax=Acropora cervicornis TaxID=6130 RepID=A0AAD9Q1Q2_ACRCE|nr:Polyamine-transporting ATPase 13A3 [Acropora cervicornis]